MASSALAAPASDATPEDNVDWLELSAFFDMYGLARVDEIAGCLAILDDEGLDDIGEIDAEDDRLREAIESEVTNRSKALGDAYPFELSKDGEVLALKSRLGRKAASFYIFCLVLSHVTRSAILLKGPSEAEIRVARTKHFQVFSTLAVAGHAQGPALSLGWPRLTGESILTVVARGCESSGTGAARPVPASVANPAAKDGGIDVLAWTPANDAPPPKSFWFAQAASGHRWRDKSARDEVESFLRDYYDIHPQCNHDFVTICPFNVSRGILEAVSRRHGSVLHRTRAPLAALNGVNLARCGLDIEGFPRAGRIAFWLGRYRKAIRSVA